MQTMNTLTYIAALFLAIAAIFFLLLTRRVSEPARKAYGRTAIIFAAVGIFLLWRSQT